MQMVISLQSSCRWNNPNQEVNIEEYSPSRRKLDHLVMVAGHAVYIGTNFLEAKQNDNWFLMPYQQVPGTAESFVQHIRMGVTVRRPRTHSKHQPRGG
jgi:hypothetical protein